jgi:DNA repair photolyase
MRTMTTPRVRTEIVDQHATWIAVNPVQGCPKRCRYCFLHERGQAGVAPEVLADPARTVELLLASPYYAPARPVALYTWTDVMALPASREHLRSVLVELADRDVRNPLVLITKCHVPDEVITDLVEARRRGVPVLVYLSLSGLNDTVERGVRHAELLENFPRLSSAGIPIVHYWRPGTPASATTAVMERVLDHAANYATCTMAAGLKVEPAALPRLAEIWPELATTEGVSTAEGVYPRAFWEFVHRTWQRHPAYPLFHTNSCALAYVLGRPDTFGIFGGTTCRLRNHCPLPQRSRCGAADAVRARPDEAQVRAALHRRGVGGAGFSLSADGRDITVHAPVDTATAAALTHDLRTRVHVDRDHTDGYWNSGTAGALPLIVG